MATKTGSKPKVLVSNDDGIEAPGIRALIAEIVKSACFDVYVSAPAGERSAQSHAITLGRYLSCAPAQVPGVLEAFAVDGTPADSVMLGMHSSLMSCNGSFDLVVSGINRGDNCGLHVIYSGTVGAAREAACKGVPAIAFSLDNHQARKEEDFEISAQISVALMRAALGLLPGQDPAVSPAEAFKQRGFLNVNIPNLHGRQLQGLHVTHMSQACVFPSFKEVKEAGGPVLAEIEEHTPPSRVFRHYAGIMQSDEAPGGDGWAMRNGWVSVTALGLRQDLGRGQAALETAAVEAMLAATSAIVAAAAADKGLAAGGVSKL
ncbi:hypothetical protein QJQ45_026485 [Haematococcus lacustris]|nr:hypothetical protein QJQ45_026485 [Haematococcus lacustris]